MGSRRDPLPGRLPVSALDGLAEFLAARLDELEAAAKAWQSPPWVEDATHWKPVGRREPRYDNGRSETFQVIDVSGRDLNWAEAIQVRWDSNGERVVHIALNDPAAVLADTAADRALLARYADCVAILEDSDPDLYAVESDLVREYESIVLPHRAVRFASHPDYSQDWRPE